MKKLLANDLDTKATLLLLLLAFIFSISMRLIWLNQFKDVKSFYWNNEIMINTNDGYYYGSGAKKLLDNSLQYESRIPKATGNGGGMIAFTYALSKYTPFSLDTVMMYSPVLVSSLVVIPIILIFRLFGQTLLGGLSAFHGSIVWSYYNRTMIGYYDSDMFSLTMPVFILYFLMRVAFKQEFRSLVVVSLLFILYMYLYTSARPVSFALALTLFGYMLLFNRKDKFTYKAILLVSISLLEFSYPVRIGLTLFVAIILYKDIITQKVLFFIALFTSLYYLYSSHVFDAVISQVLSYAKIGNTTVKTSSSIVGESYSLHFFDVKKTIMEASSIPFDIYANRLSGSIYGLFISIIGYILLTIRYKKFILAIPLLGIGFFAWIGGLRFTVYAVPVLAMGGVYFFYFIASKLVEDKVKQYIIATIGTVALIIPNIIHIRAYAVTPVFQKPIVDVLDNLKQISQPQDYCLSWWDYGYPIWYYSNLNTIVDGGKHQNDNFIASKIFTTTSQIQAVNLARYSVETYVSSNYAIIADKIFKQNNPNDLLELLDDDEYILPKDLKPKRDIYLFLPYKMLAIYPTISKFSNLDLISGREYRNPLFVQSSRFQDVGNMIKFDNGLALDKAKAELIQGTKREKIARFTIISYDKNGKFNKKESLVDFTSNLNIIYLQNFHKFLIVDNSVYGSLFFRLFVLEDYDKKLFKQISSTPLAKTYKIIK